MRVVSNLKVAPVSPETMAQFWMSEMRSSSIIPTSVSTDAFSLMVYWNRTTFIVIVLAESLMSGLWIFATTNSNVV